MHAPIKFIHTADVHFGMENYGRIDVATGIHSRLLDFEKALNYCVDFAINQDVDLFLFAGDAYKTHNPTPTQQRLLMRCLVKLYKANIPVVLVVGNHDNPLSFGKASALEVFGELPVNGIYVISKPTNLVINTKHGPVQITGIPWPTRSTLALSTDNIKNTASDITDYISKSISNIIEKLAGQLDPQLPAILCGHLTVATGIFSGSEKRAIYGNDPVFLASQLAIRPYDYVALGHLHRYQNLNPNVHPAVVYSGSIERVDFGERKEDKGFCFVTINNKEKTDHEFIKGPTRPFIQIEVVLNEIQNFTTQIIEKIKEYNIENAILKIVYYLPVGARDRVDMMAIEQACISAWYVVAIVPIKSPEIKERRLNLKVDMKLDQLLSNYFNSKTEYKDSKNILIEKALLLEQEIKNETENKA